MMIALPPKYSESQVAGHSNGKRANPVAQVYRERKCTFVGQHFWARRYFLSTVGRDETVIRENTRSQ